MKEFEQKHDFKNPVNPDRGVFSFRWQLGRPGQGPEGLQMAETFRRSGRNEEVSWLWGGKVSCGNPSLSHDEALGSQWKITMHQGGSDLCLEQGVDKPPGAWA